MAQAQMNIRIDDALKHQGDFILQKNGFSPSSAIRSMYREMVSLNDVPNFMKKENSLREIDREKCAIRDQIDYGAGLAWRLAGVEPDNEEIDIAFLKEAWGDEAIDGYQFG